jgi:hypothetical protein
MPSKQVAELRIFPPLVIGRFGSSSEPLENYDLKIVDPLGFRSIVAAPTLVVDPQTGGISHETKPMPNTSVRFRDDAGRVKPLCPFLELWVRFEGDTTFQPLTKDHLNGLGLQPSDLAWDVEAANLKVFRRTGHAGDKVLARIRIASDTLGPDAIYASAALLGFCKNFKLNADQSPKSISLGSVQFIRPTNEFPEIRLRFTPAAGRVYGTRMGDPLITDDVYAGVTAIPAPPNGPWSVPFAGSWDRYWIGAPSAPPLTAPGDIFQGEMVAGTKVSSGYLDDTCDGIVHVTLLAGGQTFTAYARFMAGVPDFAPDSYHVRTIADDLEQMAFGPDVSAPTTPAEENQIKADVIDTLRRAYETVRLMNISVQNGDQNVGAVPRNNNNMPGQETNYGRVFEPVFPTGSYDNAIQRHRAILQTALNSPKLAGSFPFLQVVRKYDEVGDLRTPMRRHMPAMMRGSDGLELALTRRQYAKLALAAPQQQPGQVAAALAVPNLFTAPTPTPKPPTLLPARRQRTRTKAVGPDPRKP